MRWIAIDIIRMCEAIILKLVDIYMCGFASFLGLVWQDITNWVG